VFPDVHLIFVCNEVTSQVKSRILSCHSPNQNIKGSHVPTLCAAPMWCSGLELCMPSASSTDNGSTSPQIFDASMLRQYGEEVQCVPFTTSPFAVLDIARNLSWTNAIIDENLKFSPSSVKANLVKDLLNHPISTTINNNPHSFQPTLSYCLCILQCMR
jgi:hypothetical protein